MIYKEYSSLKLCFVKLSFLIYISIGKLINQKYCDIGVHTCLKKHALLLVEVCPWGRVRMTCRTVSLLTEFEVKKRKEKKKEIFLSVNILPLFN